MCPGPPNSRPSSRTWSPSSATGRVRCPKGPSPMTLHPPMPAMALRLGAPSHRPLSQNTVRPSLPSITPTPPLYLFDNHPRATMSNQRVRHHQARSPWPGLALLLLPLDQLRCRLSHPHHHHSPCPSACISQIPSKPQQTSIYSANTCSSSCHSSTFRPP